MCGVPRVKEHSALRKLSKGIESTRLAEVVNHRQIIVPQLGAPGVAAHESKKAQFFSGDIRTGTRV